MFGYLKRMIAGHAQTSQRRSPLERLLLSAAAARRAELLARSGSHGRTSLALPAVRCGGGAICQRPAK
jgi:hypothetical protein